MKEDNRYCERFNMTAQQFYDYKTSKVTRIFWYIFWMIVVSIFNDRMFGYVFLTFWLIASYCFDAKREEQWIKDGSVKEEDLR